MFDFLVVLYWQSSSYPIILCLRVGVTKALLQHMPANVSSIQVLRKVIGTCVLSGSALDAGISQKHDGMVPDFLMSCTTGIRMTRASKSWGQLMSPNFRNLFPRFHVKLGRILVLESFRVMDSCSGIHREEPTELRCMACSLDSPLGFSHKLECSLNPKAQTLNPKP